ncbi:MAG: YbaB/EbfC family nucleoid-associated protein [Myxococcota bacterium]|nr:YbaB/EbfC family nucleoid-associated protein [Myxococcota bacterium]
MSQPPNLQDMLAKAQEVQQRLAQIQQELARKSVEGSAGGGMVTAVVTGELRVLEVKIEPSLLETGDREMLQDLVAAAVNAGLARAREMVQQEMQKAAGGVSIPGLGAT